MMSKAAFLAGLFSLGVLCLPVRADEGRTGRIGFAVQSGAAVPVLGKRIREIGDTGLDIGAMVRYGLNPHWEGTFSVERANTPKVDATPILVGGMYSFFPGLKLTPVLRLAGGYVRLHGIGNDSDEDDRLAFKPGFGLELQWCPCFSLGAYADLLWSPQAEPSDKVYGAFTGGLLAAYYFGRSGK